MKKIPASNSWVDGLVSQAEIRVAVLRAVASLSPSDASALLASLAEDVSRPVLPSIPLLPPKAAREEQSGPFSEPRILSAVKPRVSRAPKKPRTQANNGRKESILSSLGPKGAKTSDLVCRLGVADDHHEVHRVQVALSAMKRAGLILRSDDGVWSRSLRRSA